MISWTLLVELGLAAADPGELQRVADNVAVGAGMGADPDVVEHRQIGEQRDVLEGAADADFGDPVRRARQDAPALDQNVAGARLVEPGEAVEQGGLAGAVRPDQAEDCALVHVERHAVQGNDAAEHDADVANREQGPFPCASCACVIESRPDGLGGTTARTCAPVV